MNPPVPGPRPPARRWSERTVRRVAAQLVADAETIVAATRAAPSVQPLNSALAPFGARWWVLLVGGWAVGVAALFAGWLALSVLGAAAHVSAVLALLVAGGDGR